MSLSPLLAASLIIQVHVFAAIAAFGLGAWVLFSRKGTARHKLFGKVWVALMVIVALTSLFIWQIRMMGLFSPIHILSVLTFTGLYGAIQAARRGDIAKHRSGMQQLYLGALIIAGFFTFMPGRIMSRVLFGEGAVTSVQWVLFVIGFGVSVATGYWILRGRMGWQLPLTRQ